MKILIAHDGSDFANAILDDLPYAGLPARAEVAVITLAEPEYFLVGKKSDGAVEWLSYGSPTPGRAESSIGKPARHFRDHGRFSGGRRD
jgi:hypothetical protein